MASNFYISSASNQSFGQNEDLLADLEVKYWSARIITSILEDIVYADPPHPKVSQTTLEQLRSLLFQIDLEVCRKHLKQTNLSMNGDGSEPEKFIDTLGESSELTPESQTIIKALISLSVQKMAITVLKFWNIQRGDYTTEKIQETVSSSGDEVELKTGFTKLITKLKELKLEEDVLDRDIEEAEFIRMQEMLTYVKELNEVKEMMTDLMGETLLKKKPQVMTTYIDHLKSHSELMNTKIQCAKLQQQIAEHPPELVDEFEKTYNELKATVTENESQCHLLKDKLAKYESLGDELLEIAKEYQIVEETIKTKEWVLQQLALANASGDHSLDASSF